MATLKRVATPSLNNKALDQSLSGESIVEHILHKSSNKLKFLYRNARNFDLNTKKLLVSALIQCHFDYACSSWYSGLSMKWKGRLQTMQNKIIRFMTNSPPRTHIGYGQFKQVGFLPVDYRVEQMKLGHMFSIISGNAPNYLKAGVVMVHDHHSYSTRASVKSCVVPRIKSFGQWSFLYTAILRWNALPRSIQLCNTLTSFKKNVKKYLWAKIASRS